MGASNLAARRGAKANRRKMIVAQKRKAEAAGSSLAGQAMRAAALPIRDCLVSENLFDGGMGSVLLARGSGVGSIVVGVLLVDTFCRGVKDVILRELTGDQYETFVGGLDRSTPLIPADPRYARKLLRDVVQWAGSHGFQPHRDFAAAEQLFGNVDPRACDTIFEFGQGGKPLYTSGPTDSPAIVRRHLEQLRQQLGPEGFNYIVGG